MGAPEKGFPFFINNKVNLVMSKRTKNWQDKLLGKYRIPKDGRKTSILNKKQLNKVLKDDEPKKKKS